MTQDRVEAERGSVPPEITRWRPTVWHIVIGLPLENLLLGINAKPGVSASRRHGSRGLHILMMDGSVKFVKAGRIDPVLSLWANKSDGEEATECSLRR